MSSPQRVLILTGLFLIACAMAFGVWYAIFDEHQTLVGMGVHMPQRGRRPSSIHR